jgi:hypothetical protein
VFAFFFEGVEAFLEGAFDADGGDVVGLVVGELAGAAVFGDVDEALDGIGDGVAEEDAFAGEVACGAAGGLDEGGFVAEEAFFVGVEDADEGDFREVETFAE